MTDYGWLGCKKFTPAPSEPQTNEEYLKSYDTEQLAEWICSVHEKCYYCGAKRISDRECCPFGDGKCRNNKHEFAMWLKQPHTQIRSDDMTWEYICRVDCHDVNGVKTWADKYRCPVCGFIHTCVENHGLYNYCPQCGERMKQPHQ